MKKLLVLGLVSLSAMSMENPGTAITNRREYKRAEQARRLFAVLPYYHNLTSYYDGAVTESDSAADLVDFDITPEQQNQKCRRRAQEKYNIEVARARQQPHFNTQMADALALINPSVRVELYEKIMKAHGNPGDPDYEGDDESDVMDTITNFGESKKTRNRDW